MQCRVFSRVLGTEAAANRDPLYIPTIPIPQHSPSPKLRGPPSPSLRLLSSPPPQRAAHTSLYTSPLSLPAPTRERFEGAPDPPPHQQARAALDPFHPFPLTFRRKDRPPIPTPPFSTVTNAYTVHVPLAGLDLYVSGSGPLGGSELEVDAEWVRCATREDGIQGICRGGAEDEGVGREADEVGYRRVWERKLHSRSRYRLARCALWHWSADLPAAPPPAGSSSLAEVTTSVYAGHLALAPSSFRFSEMLNVHRAP